LLAGVNQPQSTGRCYTPTVMAPPLVVTGAAGFIGSHLSQALLERGEHVVGIDNFDPFYAERLKRANVANLDHERFRFIEMDICDVGLAPLFAQLKPAAIFHMAALAGVRPSIEQPARYLQVNIDGTLNVLEAAREASCNHIVFASSSSVYGNNRKVPFAETDPVDEPISPYAASKRAAELVCHAHCHLFGMSVAALRFFTVYGPAQRPDLAIGKFMGLIETGQEVPMFGDGASSRDYTYIDDIIDGVLAGHRFVQDAPAGTCRIFNLGGSRPVSLADMIRDIGKVVGRQPQIQQLPMQPGDVDQTYADLTRSAAELGYEPRTPFIEGLRRQWAWVQENAETFNC
jgi:UDP-glucuronate 4-epimerase